MKILSHLREIFSGRLIKILAGDALGSFVVRIVSLALSFATIVVLARLTDPSQLGAYTYAISLISFLQIITLLGADRWLVREVSDSEARGAHGAIRVLRNGSLIGTILACLIAGGGIWVLISFFPGLINREAMPAVIVALWLLPMVTLLAVFQAYMRGLRRAVVAQVPGEVVRPILLLACIFLVFRFAPEWLDGAGIVLLQIVAATITLAMLWSLAKKYTPADVRGGGSGMNWRSWLRDGIPLVGIALVNKGNAYILTLLLGGMSDMASVAFFGVAKRLSDLTTFMQAAIVLPLAPAIAKAFATGEKKEMRKLAAAAAWGGSLFAIPVTVVVVAFAEPLLGIFGDRYSEASWGLRILGLGQAVTVMMGPVTVWLTMTRHERTALLAAGAGLVVMICVAYWLIPTYRVEGAAVAFVSGLFTTQILMLSQVVRLIEINPTVLTFIGKTRTGRSATGDGESG